MKSLMPWLCLLAVSAIQASFAAAGLDAYRQGDYVTAVGELGKTSNRDPMVDYYLGRMRLYGYGQLKNNTLAIRHFRQSAEKGFLPAQNIMARFALFEENNPKQALYWFKKAAKANVTHQRKCIVLRRIYLGSG